MSITGNLRTLELSELLQWLAQGNKTGVLIIDNTQVQKRIYFDRGTIVSSESSDSQEHLGHFLIEEGLIDEPTLARALKLQQATQILLGKVLVTLGAITEKELNQVLRQKTQETIYELFNWSEGEFRFVPDDLPEFPMVPIALDVTNVVLEGMRRIDEENRQAAGHVDDQAAVDARDLEETMASDILEPLNISSVEIPRVVEDSGVSRERSSVIEEDFEGTLAPSVRGFYQTSAAKRDDRVKLLAAVAAGIVVIFLAVVAYFFWPAEPSEARTQEELRIPERFNEFEPAPTLESVGLLPPSEAAVDLELTAAIEPPTPGGQSRSQEEQLRAEYERELQTLRQQLRDAQRQANESPPAVTTQLASNDPPTRAEALPQRIGRTTVVAPQPEGLEGTEGLAVASEDAASKLVEPGGEESDQESAADPLPAGDRPDARPDVLAEIPAQVQRGDLVEPGPGVTNPTIIDQPRPRYPDAARRLGRTAIVVLRLLIDEQGRVEEIQQTGNKAGLGFDRAAIVAAEKTTWAPAKANGTPVKMWVELQIEFQP